MAFDTLHSEYATKHRITAPPGDIVRTSSDCIVGMCGIDFFYFDSVSIRFFEKSRIPFRMSFFFGSVQRRFYSDIVVVY